MKKILILFTSLLLLSCSSDDNANSNPTPTGSNTVYFTLDDKLYSSEFPTAAIDNKSITVSDNVFSINLRIINDKGVVTLTLFTGEKIEEGKSYQIHEQRIQDGFFVQNSLLSQPSTSFDCKTSAEFKGTVSIVKLDYENRIVAATFSYDAVDRKQNVHKVRNGWFDLKF